MKQKVFSRRLSVILVLAMIVSSFCLPGAAFAADRTSPFTDLAETHWAYKSVIKLQCRGVIAGYSNNLYKPDNVISQVEAGVLAVRNLAKSSEIAQMDDSKDLPFDVPEWAKTNNKKELLYAVQRGIIDPDDFTATKAATRAWFTKLMVRMCGMENDAKAAADTATTFADNSSITADTLGYVNVAVAKGFISGYIDNTFMPDKYVTRVEAASMLDRCEPYLSLSSTVRLGTIKGIVGSMMTVQTANGDQNVLLADSTWLFDEKGKMIDADALNEGDNIKFIMGNTNVLYAEKTTQAVVLNTTSTTATATDATPATTTATTAANVTKGTVMYVSENDSLLVMRKTDGSILTCNVAYDADIKDASGVEVALANLPSGASIEVTANSNGELDTITLKTNTASGTTTRTGIVYQIVPEQKLIMLTGSNDEISSFQYTSLVDVTNGSDSASISDVVAGDEVKLTIDNGIVSTIDILTASKSNYTSGTIELMPENSDMIIVKVDGTNQIFNLTEKTSVVIPGNSAASRSSLKVGDAVRLYVSEGAVTKIEVQNRLVGNELEGTVSAIDTREDVLVLETSSGVTYSYKLKSNVRILIDSADGDLSDISVGDTVSVTLTNNEISTITALSGMVAKVTKVDTDRMLIGLRNTVTGDEYTYAVTSNPEVILEGSNKSSLTNVHTGDTVRVKVEDDVVKAIEIQRTFNYTVTSVNTASSRLGVITDTGTTRTIYLKSSVAVTIPGVDYPSVYDFKTGDQIAATYLGNVLKSVEMVPYTVGKVTAVDTDDDTFTVESFSGTETTYDFTDNSIIYTENTNNGSKSESSELSTIAVDDRVMVMEKDDDVTVYRMDKLTGTFVSYMSDSNQVRIIQTPSIVSRTYSYNNSVYLHQGNNTIGWGSFYVNENIVLYLHESQVYEVEVAN